MTKRNIYRLTLFLSCIFVLVFVGIGILFLYRRELTDEQRYFETREIEKTDLIRTKINEEFTEAIEDLSFIKGLYSVYSLSPEILQKYLESNPQYDSVMYMNIGNTEDNALLFISKEDRPISDNEEVCIQKTVTADENILHFSKLEPFENEQGVDITKPEICIGSAIYQNGKKVGIIAINYMGSEIINTLDSHKDTDGSRLSLFDENGYWLYSNFKSLDWGFAFEDRLYQSFKLLNSKLWNELEKKEEDQFYTEEGLYTVKTLNLPDNKQVWKLVSFVPVTTLYKSSTNSLNFLIGLDIAVIFVVIIFFLVLTRVFSKREDAEKKTEQLYKIITIINRILRHDIANLLTGINVAYDMYESEKDEQFLKEGFKKSREGIELINRMRRLEDLGRQGRNLEHINLHELIHTVSQRFDIPIAVSGSATVLADSALDAVVYNIIENAIKHGHTDKMEIEIDTDKKRYVYVSFRDFGIGIEDEIKNKVFDEGYKYRSSGNTGIGLYIVKETIEGYGGSVKVEDTDPQGATFVVTLPRL